MRFDILISIQLNREILEMHKQYILTSDIRSKIKVLKNNNKLFIKLPQKLKYENEKFCDFILEEIDSLNSIEIEDNNNLFIGNVKTLNDKSEIIKKEFPYVYNAFFSNEPKYSNYMEYVLDCFGYKNFQTYTNIYYYEKEKEFLLRFKQKYLDNEIHKYKLKCNLNKYCESIGEEVKKNLLDKIEGVIRTCKSSNMNEFWIEMYNDIYEKCICKTKKIFVSSIMGIIKSKLIDLDEMNLKKSLINIDTYNKYELKHKGEKVSWNAYHFLFKLGLKVCPYCNRQYITPIVTENGKMRADLDHFFAKSLYPYLSISIYNLVPSCKLCNSSLKGAQNFTYDKNLNPYERGMENILRFDYIPKSYDSFYGQDEVEMKIRSMKNTDYELIKKAQNNTKIFNLEQVYQYHTDIVKKILLKRRIYSDSYIKQLVTEYNDIFKQESEVVRLIIGNIPEEEVKNTPLAKMKNDVINQIFESDKF